MKLTQEQLTKIKNAKSVEELSAIAKNMNLDMNEQDLQKTFDALQKTGELADEELNNVAGGSACGYDHPDMVCPNCGHKGMNEDLLRGWRWYYICTECWHAYKKNEAGELVYHYTATADDFDAMG